MATKFIIVNNGMTGLRGHYFETGVSMAREAQKRGFHTAMAAHVTCGVQGLPPGLDFYPLFQVDHWGAKVAQKEPGLYGLRGCLRALKETTIDDVLAGRATMEQYLLARFEPLECALTNASSIGRRARVKQVAKRILPPIAVYPVRLLARHRHLSKQLVRSLLPPFLFDRLKHAMHRSVHGQAPGAVSAHLATSATPPISYDLRIETYLRAALARAMQTRRPNFGLGFSATSTACSVWRMRGPVIMSSCPRPTVGRHTPSAA